MAGVGRLLRCVCAMRSTLSSSSNSRCAASIILYEYVHKFILYNTESKTRKFVQKQQWVDSLFQRCVLYALYQSGGKFEFRGSLRLSWLDEYRVWNKSQVPVSEILIPANEVWTPNFFLANCVSRDCNVVPHNRTNVEVLLLFPLIRSRGTLVNCNMEPKKTQYFNEHRSCTVLITKFFKYF